MNCNTIYCSECTIADDMVILIPNREIKNVANACNYRLIICCNINTPESNYPLAIQVGTNNIPVLCKYGNEILSNQVNKRTPYCIGYGNNNTNYTNGQFVIMNTKCLNARGTESAPTGETTDGD